MSKSDGNSADAPRTRILLVEDEFLLGVMLEDDLTSEGFSVLGPVATLADALQIAATEEFALALLDVNLRGEHVYPVADCLAARGIPFILLSGYGEAQLPQRLRDCCKLTKPCDLTVLRQHIHRLIGAGSA
jgi:DNA-binding response OmpR family regulator